MNSVAPASRASAAARSTASRDVSEPSVLAQQIEQILLGGKRRYNRIEAAAAAGVSTEEATRLWRALGFASVADDGVVFTKADVTALRNAFALVESAMIDEQLLSSVTRMLGQTLSRTA
jgi:adenylate cyclase